MNFITECAKNETFLELCKFTKELIDRREPEELVLRFFTYLNNRADFDYEMSEYYGIDISEMSYSDALKTFKEQAKEEEKQRIVEIVKNHGNTRLSDYLNDWQVSDITEIINQISNTK